MRKVITSVAVVGVNDKEFGRERALHKYVASNQRLQAEFHAMEKGKYHELYYNLDRDSVNKYWDGMNKFIKKKSFKIISERATLIERDTCYDVMVSYQIEEEF